jgi:hypothetical protein
LSPQANSTANGRGAGGDNGPVAASGIAPVSLSSAAP